MSKINSWDLYLNHSQYPCVVADANTKSIIYANSLFVDFFKVPYNLIGMNLNDLTPIEHRQYYAEIFSFKNSKKIEQDFFLKSINDYYKALFILDENIETVLIIIKPPTNTLNVNLKIDNLTGLFNRVGYSQKIDLIMQNPPKSIGIISMNVNGVRDINKDLGLTIGDEHIKKSALLLKEHFGYKFFRLSGDEFIGIAPNVEKQEFEDKVNELHEILRKDNNYDFSFGHSWGNGKFDFNKLVQEAEVIMYINKQEYYTTTKREFNKVSDKLLSDLLSYLENDEFMVYLQPQVILKDGSLYGAEALIRRFDKTNQKMQFPDQFIPLYEQNSIIRHIDMFVVDKVCQLLAEWNEQGKAIPISVNLSRVTLQEFGIVDTIIKICDKYNVPHELLVIEVTERVGLIENNVASSLITDFQKNNFNISLDDFGCAYSNIVTLSQIDVNEIKVDKSLVDYIMTNPKSLVLVKNVLSICNDLNNTSSLAEGIETKEQAEKLHELGCHLGQGYYYSRPIPVDEFIEKYIG